MREKVKLAGFRTAACVSAFDAVCDAVDDAVASSVAPRPGGVSVFVMIVYVSARNRPSDVEAFASAMILTENVRFD